MTTVTDRVSASLHDASTPANEAAHPFFSATGSLWWGEDADQMYNGMIWDGVNIPSGATFQDGCNIQITDVQFGSFDQNMDVRGIKTATLTEWSAASSPVDRVGNATTAAISWQVLIGSGATVTSPEIKTVLQEIADAVGAITDLTLILEDPEGVANAITDVESFDTSAAEAPFVTIEYTAGAGGGAAPVRHDLGLLGVGR